jgi:regulator of cell morphogenesis and NO signaling
VDKIIEDYFVFYYFKTYLCGIKIIRMIDLKNKTIAEIVTADISKATIFKKYNIDFCCGGGTTIEKACLKANLDVNEVINDLIQENSNNASPNLDFKSFNSSFLTDYIINVHHTYVTETIEVINEFAAKVAHVHGAHAPETVEIAELFSELSEELLAHMVKEETILFPAIKSKIGNKTADYDKNVVEMLEDEHEVAGNIAKKIQELSNNFTPPDWACNTFKALYYKLDEFISDLYQHIHLENNILFHKIRG